mgnify:CR=1 FL=1
MKTINITKQTALFSTKAILMLSAVFVVGVFVGCSIPTTAVEEENPIVEEEIYAHENKVLQWYFDKIGFTPTSDICYYVLISTYNNMKFIVNKYDVNDINCGDIVLDEMLNQNLDSTMLIITSKLMRKYPFLSENSNIFWDEKDIINTLNWDYIGITDVELSNGKIVEIHEHDIKIPNS